MDVASFDNVKIRSIEWAWKWGQVPGYLGRYHFYSGLAVRRSTECYLII